MLGEPMSLPVIISLVALGLVALASGALIALFATRRAPDGFEDADGCHLSNPPRRRAG
jgi:hypothetical protein